MGWVRQNSHWVLFACFLVSTILTVIVGILGVFAGLGALSPSAAVVAEEFVVIRMLEAALPYVLATVFLGILDVVFLVGTVVAVLRKASMPKSDRLAEFAKRAENEVPMLGSFGVSDRVEPDAQYRREELKQQYVDGEISEKEFERRMSEVLDEDEDDPLLNDEFDRNKSRKYEFE